MNFIISAESPEGTRRDKLFISQAEGKPFPLSFSKFKEKTFRGRKAFYILPSLFSR